MAEDPVASPSMPSARLAELDTAVIIKTVIKRNNKKIDNLCLNGWGTMSP